MTQILSILGSTGSIGRQALEVAEHLGLRVAALAAQSNVDCIEQQIRRFRPELAVLTDTAAANDLKIRVRDLDVRILSGKDGLLQAAAFPQADTVLMSVMGMVGLEPTLEAIRAGKRIALANKETLVCGGKLIMAEARAHATEIIPVDSEHSAIFQCLQGCRNPEEIRRLIITASGGPFYGKSFSELEKITRADALHHPNWTMGQKITIDSATMMNKGLECIEAMWLFDLPLDKIIPVIHRQSIVHSLVEFRDGAVLAQLGIPDMHLPIQYALTWPNRAPTDAKALDLLSCGPLTFDAPDYNAFPCLQLALQAARTGGTATAILNGANEEAVSLFLDERILFNDIFRLVCRALDSVRICRNPSLEDILKADLQAREVVRSAMH